MQASLATSLGVEFSGLTIAQSHALISADAVEVVQFSTDVLQAWVGEEAAEVEIVGERVRVRCSCEAAPCLHICALLLKAENAGYAYTRYANGAGFRRDRPQLAIRRTRQREPEWKRRLRSLRVVSDDDVDPWSGLRGAAGDEIRYVLDVGHSNSREVLVLTVQRRQPTQSGKLGKWKPFRGDLTEVAASEDREVLCALYGSLEPGVVWRGGESAARRAQHAILLDAALVLLPPLCDRGALFIEVDDQVQDGSVAWDPEEHRFGVSVDRRDGEFVVQGFLDRAGERIWISEALALVRGLVVFRDRVAPLRDGGAFAAAEQLWRLGGFVVPASERPALQSSLIDSIGEALLDVPDLQEVEGDSVAGVRLMRDDGRYLHAQLFFEHAGVRMVPGQVASRVVAGTGYVARDSEFEAAALRRFLDVGGKHLKADDADFVRIPKKRLASVLGSLASDGWRIESDQFDFRMPNRVDATLRTEIDWFDLEGGVDFDGVVVPFPKLLAAVAAGDAMIDLGDGRVGILPEGFAAEWRLLRSFGKAEGDVLRFKHAQAWILDSLLTSKLEARADQGFSRLRERLARFDGISAVEPSAEFRGGLRDYQKGALGWFEFLREFGFGGCLADDMGLGKTVQVIALLQSRRGTDKPSLVVSPRSVAFHWIDEAMRFAPDLRVVSYAGPERSDDRFDEVDVVVTTYGTLRRDITKLERRAFDYVVLDEAQAIKNPRSQASKAVRILDADHRLALSGTPIENHLGDLWALFEFLNPGMLGSSGAFDKLAKERRGDGVDRSALARAMRPFFLRRTKEQVLTDLPEKSEQTIFCELSAGERKDYDELRDHYRSALLGTQSAHSETMHVLEALLRLRQAACHPGLMDPQRSGEESAKLEVLLAQLRGVTESGHKALVFSQFTSLLGIVSERLSKQGVVFEYLDGKTRDRRKRVERFQHESECSTFLISLRAGGQGLHLTAADYVFLLDPWWNPAVERQAIDRAHRYGQTKAVFAYRLVCKDTVEEKVLQLQRQKRELADALFAEDASLLRDLSRSDLEVLLS